MMFSVSKIVCTLVTFASFSDQTTTFAFKPISLMSSKPKTSFIYNGDIAPLGYFDPLQFTQSADESTLKYLREAELHHGRVAMIASLMLPSIDYFTPEPDDLAINYFSENHGEFNQLGLVYMAFFEFTRLLTLYKPLDEKLFRLKDNIQPGMINTYVSFDENMSNIELSNGRLAMIGALGYIVQELVTQQKVISG